MSNSMCAWPVIHKRFSLLIGPNDFVLYDVSKFLRFVGLSVVANAPTDWLLICVTHAKQPAAKYI